MDAKESLYHRADQDAARALRQAGTGHPAPAHWSGHSAESRGLASAQRGRRDPQRQGIGNRQGHSKEDRKEDAAHAPVRIDTNEDGILALECAT